MKMTLAIPVLNQLQDAKGILALLKFVTSPETEIMIIDNGSTEDYETFLTEYLKFPRLNYIRNEQNIGLVASMQQAYDNCTTDVLGILHNDVFIYEHNWDQRILQVFADDATIGGVGFLGAQGCGPLGERIQDVYAQGQPASMSNMLEAEMHGIRLRTPVRSAAIFDGLGMFFRMQTLKASNGFDQRYMYHHYYDRDASLEVLRHGYKNVVVNIPFHHLSGLTANRGDYQNWVSEKTKAFRTDQTVSGDKFVHDKNAELFAKKWAGVLPLYISDDFTYRNEKTHGPGWQLFKGDAITRLATGQ